MDGLSAGPEVKVSVLRPGAALPEYQSAGAAGADLAACLDADLDIGPFERALVPTGLAIELPAGYEAQVRSRSGNAIKKGLAVLNSPGTIDSDYRGEVQVILINLSPDRVRVRHGDRVAQLVVAPVERARFAPAAALGATGRDANGFGSTGS